MSELLARQKLDDVATVVAAPRIDVERAQPSIRTATDRSFQLPTALYVATVSGYLGFIGVMAAAFIGSELILPMAIFVILIAAAFGTPTIWVRMQPENPQRAMSYRSFMRDGIETATGHLSGGEAAVQVLILPALIFLWGVAVAVIASLT